MELLDKYIVKKFFLIFPTLIIGIISLICLISYIVDVFVLENYAASKLKFYQLIYFYTITTIASFNILIPFLAYISTALIISKMADRCEIIAILSLGISYKRLIRPMLISSVFLMKVMLICECWIMPEINKIRENLNYEYFEDGIAKSGRNIHLKLKNVDFVYIEYFDKYSESGRNIIIDKILGNKLVSRFKAKKLKWNSDNNVWEFHDWEMREIGEMNDSYSKGSVIEKGDIGLYPSDLIFDQAFQTKLNMDELNSVVNRLEEHGIDNKVFRIEQMKRTVRPIIIILVIMVGVLFYSKKTRKGSKKSTIIGFLLVCGIIISSIVAEDIALYSTRNIYVLFIVPLIFFSIINFIAYRRFR